MFLTEVPQVLESFILASLVAHRGCPKKNQGPIVLAAFHCPPIINGLTKPRL